PAKGTRRAPSSRCSACRGVFRSSVSADKVDSQAGQALERAGHGAGRAAPLSALPERFTRAMPRLLLRWAPSGGASLQGGIALGGAGQSFCLSVQGLRTDLLRLRRLLQEKLSPDRSRKF